MFTLRERERESGAQREMVRERGEVGRGMG